jgi:hypothetical protein
MSWLQAVETFLHLKMSLLTSVRSAFLDSLAEVCTRYIHIMKEAGHKEQVRACTAR